MLARINTISRSYSTAQNGAVVKNLTIIGSGLMGSGIAQVNYKFTYKK